MMKLDTLVEHLYGLLEIEKIEDDSLNGLQVENSGEVEKVALAVDACSAAFERAADLGAGFLFVHHGLFWGKPVPIRQTLYRRIQILIESNIALYAAHLPLDLHAEFGNNAQIAKVLGWPIAGDFGEYHGSIIGKEVQFDTPVDIDDVANHLQNRLSCKPVVWKFGNPNIKRLSYISGGGLGMLEQAIDAKMDAYITGEPGHSSYWLAKEAQINVIFSGHYATETLGVKAIGKHLREEFDLETGFIELPTGL